MLLYELAIVLNQRSTDLIAAGAQLGLGELQTASDLRPDQVAALKAHFGAGAAPAPLPPLGTPGAVPPPPPAVAPGAPMPGPATWGPPAPASGPAPVAPPAWGPPTSAPMPPTGPNGAAPAGPTTWGPPTATPPTPPGHAGPVFDYPSVSGPATWGPPQAPVPGPVPAEPAPGRSSTAQKVLIGAVVLAALGLFAFMATNTGADEGRKRDIAARNAALDDELAATTVPPTEAEAAGTTVPAADTTVPATDAPALDDDAAVDVAAFCAGGKGIVPLELRIAAAIADGDFDELQQLIRERRAGWSEAVDEMARGAAPSIVDDIEAYRAGYIEYFDAIESSSSLSEVIATMDRSALTRAMRGGAAINAELADECQ